MKTSTLTALILAFSLLSHISVGADKPIKFETDPSQRLDARFRLFKTQNMWTQLLLDTRNGRVLQVNFSVNEKDGRGWIPINDNSLIDDEKNAKDGRFTLYPTENLWTFILLDQDNGRVWQCQFSLEKQGRFILPISSTLLDSPVAAH